MQSTRIHLARLRSWRIYRLMSQRDLALAAGLNKATVMTLEAGTYRANFSTVHKLARALRIEPETLAWSAPELPDEIYNLSPLGS
jgi:DNA-binding XRE family transcriptional regulator